MTRISLGGFRAVCAGGLFLASAALAPAQSGEAAFQTMDYMPFLLFNPKVQSDLGLSPEVAQKEQSIMLTAAMSMMPNPKEGGNGQGQQPSKILGMVNAVTQQALAPLTLAQRKRLHQLTLQALGPSVLASPKIADALGLSAAQRAKINACLRSEGAAMSTHVQAFGGQQGAVKRAGDIRTLSLKMRQSEDAVVKQTLTSAQRAKWAAMEGKILPGLDDMMGFGSMMGR